VSPDKAHSKAHGSSQVRLVPIPSCRSRADSHSKFGLAFQQAAEESGAGAKHDMFDTSVVEVRQADLQGFIESLHLLAA
jgi:hypothetical protein